jgi:hypothetical protein
MIYKTYAELKLKVQRETDTQAEDFVTDEELMSYFQDAVNECEAHIHKMGLDNQYFLSRASADLAIGQQSVDLPDDIYATKILRLILAGNGKVYTIRRMKSENFYERMENINIFNESSDAYEYIILNSDGATLPVIEIWPPSKDAGTNILKIYYIRSAVEIDGDDSVIDIPEFYSFICGFVKYKIYDKEGSVMAADAKIEMERQRQLMLDTLAEQTPDSDNLIEPDLSSYEEMS